MCRRHTYQPNNPNVHPPVGEKMPIAHLIASCQHKPVLHAKLLMLSEFFSDYRPVLGDGNCFYRRYDVDKCACCMASTGFAAFVGEAGFIYQSCTLYHDVSTF